MTPSIDTYWWTALVVVVSWAICTYLLTIPLLEILHRRRVLGGLPFVASQAILGVFNLAEALVYFYTLTEIRHPGALWQWDWLLRWTTYLVLIFIEIRALVALALYLWLRRRSTE